MELQTGRVCRFILWKVANLLESSCQVTMLIENARLWIDGNIAVQPNRNDLPKTNPGDCGSETPVAPLNPKKGLQNSGRGNGFDL